MKRMKTLREDKWRCPACKKMVVGYPALSRIDNLTEICSKCGVIEALVYYTNLRKQQK